MNHSLPLGLEWGRGTVAHFAKSPASRLLIFVHGFGGNATKTWKGMTEILDDPVTANTDIAFYGYGSLAAPAQNSATLFRNFADEAFGGGVEWTKALQRAVPGRLRPTYTQMLIVAHSLGAVITRRAILDGIELGQDWSQHARLLLFGPAHSGTRLVALKKMLHSGIGSILSDLFTVAQINVPVLDDLEAGSNFLNHLKADSQTRLASHGESIRALSVLFGERDNVVVTDRFCEDPISAVAPGEDHCSVCRTPKARQLVSAHL